MVFSPIIKAILILCLTWAALSYADNEFQPTFIASHLPYQAHSFNDLNITRNIMLKKVKYFKFDASLANRQSCTKYSTWNSKKGCFNSSFYAQQICCIALRGDAGSQPDFNFPFNTTEELVSLVKDFLGKYNETIEILFFQLDIQFKFEFKNKLIENTLYQLSMLMREYNKLHITVDESHILQYDRICRHYNNEDTIFAENLGNKVGDEACNANRKVISQSEILLQSSSMSPYDSRDYKGRYRNFNTIVTSIDHFCSTSFPTWPNKYPQYPLIFWEPSNEEGIQYALSKLFQPSCARKHNRNLSGIAFASNIEPQMFEIFMKRINLNDFSKQFPWNILQNKVWLENITSIKLTSIRQVNDQIKTKSKERLVISWQSMEGNQKKNYLNIFFQNDTTLNVHLYKTIEVQGKVVDLHSIKDHIIAVVRKDEETTKQFQATILILNSNLQVLKSKVITSFMKSYTDPEMIYYIARTSSPTYFNLYYMDSSLGNATQYSASTFMNKEVIDSISSIYFKKGTGKDKDIFLVFHDQKEFTIMNQIINGYIHKLKKLTYGTNSRVVDKYDGNILISLENSYSHGGVLFNNNAENKCYLHKVLNSERLAHLPYLVNLLQGKFQSFMNFFQEDSDEIITGCHPTINFSKHLNGKDIQITSIWNSVILATKYVPLNQQDLMVTLFSGGSNYEDSLRNKTGFMLVSANANSRYPVQQKGENIFAEE